MISTVITKLLDKLYIFMQLIKKILIQVISHWGGQKIKKSDIGIYDRLAIEIILQAISDARDGFNSSLGIEARTWLSTTSLVWLDVLGIRVHSKDWFRWIDNRCPIEGIYWQASTDEFRVGVNQFKAG